MRRARVPGVVAAFPTQGPPASPRSLVTPQLDRRAPEPGISRVREAPDQSVWAPPLSARRSGPTAPGAPRAVELFRLRAIDLDSRVGVPVPPDMRAKSLIVVNPLAAPIFFRWGGGAPSANDYDDICPGESRLVAHIAGVDRISAVVDYPGAVPGGDLLQTAIVSVSEVALSPSVGAMVV